MLVACAPTNVTRPGNVEPLPEASEPAEPLEVPALNGRTVRVAVATRARTARLSATAGWRIYERGGSSVLVRAGSHDAWTVEESGGRLRAVSEAGRRTELREGPFLARAERNESGDDRAMLTLGGRRYRGDIIIVATDSGLLVINHLPIESYLRGVVPLEIGERAPGEEAAVAAQAVAARSYTYARLADLGPRNRRAWDLVAGSGDQVYGGADAERAIADEAVTLTGNLVLRFGGRIVNAVYSSTCGGSTAEAHELWQTQGEPYLQRVSDRIPGSDRYYCDLSPRFRWTRSFDARALASLLETYLRSYTTVSGTIGTVQSVEIERRTESGRVATLAIATDRGRYVLRGNNMRYVLRSPNGEILNSTYFSVGQTSGENGRLTRLDIGGGGYGHGVGMCQWGAIGRAREGQDYRAILRTYYPGTTLEPVG
jgi:stage II sporulation protein D